MSFFRYPGGKSKLRTEIIHKLLSKLGSSFLQYREPFFGGGGIGLRLLEIAPNIKDVWINDKDVGIACLWFSVLHNPEELKKRIRQFKPSVKLFYEIKEELLSLDKMSKYRKRIIDAGFKKLAIHQISYSGLGTKSGGPLGGADQKSRYKIDCRWSPDYICKKIDKINKFLSSFSVTCTNIDFREMISDNSKPSLLYLDPPYFIKGEDLYQHSFDRADHVRLAVELQHTQHAWVLSYDDCQEIRAYYKWANVETIDTIYSITAQKDKQTGERLSRQKKELLIYT